MLINIEIHALYTVKYFNTKLMLLKVATNQEQSPVPRRMGSVVDLTQSPCYASHIRSNVVSDIPCGLCTSPNRRYFVWMDKPLKLFYKLPPKPCGCVYNFQTET